MSKNSPSGQDNNRHIKARKAQNGDLTVTEGEMFVGSMPHPDILAGYNAVVPGAAERILKMAENQASHNLEISRIELEQRGDEERHEYNLSSRGQHYALVFVLVALAGAFYCILKDHEVAGAMLGGATMISIVSAFIYGHKKSQPAEKK